MSCGVEIRASSYLDELSENVEMFEFTDFIRVEQNDIEADVGRQPIDSLQVFPTQIESCQVLLRQTSVNGEL